GPEPVPDKEIDGICLLIKSKLLYDAHPYLHKGMPVEVIRGPLEGIRGIFKRNERPGRLVISVHLIRQAVSVAIDAADVITVEPIRTITISLSQRQKPC